MIDVLIYPDVSEDIDLATDSALATRAGGENTGDF